MDIRVVDMKMLDTSLNKDLLGQVITDVVLAKKYIPTEEVAGTNCMNKSIF